MSVLEWISLGIGTAAYFLGHYHGSNKGLAKAGKVLSQFVPEDSQDSPASVAGSSDVDAAAARAGTAAGAAANAASHMAGPHR